MTALVSQILATMATIALLMGGVLALSVQDLSLGAGGGVPALQGVATTTVVGPSNIVTVFSSKANCTNRVISTTDGSGQAIQVLYGSPTNGDVTTPTEVIGHLQAGSTTVAYDSALYGCGAFKVFASASTTLLISEFY